MNDELLSALSNKTRTLVRNMASAAVIEAFDSRGKNVTGRTIKSVSSFTQELDGNLVVTTGAGGGAKYIVAGKPAGTKMPVRKVGGRFELVPLLKEWKEAKGLSMPDYLLARSIAKNKRDPVDIASIAFDIWQEKYQPIVTRMIKQDVRDNFAKQLAHQIKRVTQ